MSHGENLTLKENLDEAGRELQRLRSQLSTLGELVGSPDTAPDEAKAFIQSISMHIWKALSHIRAAKDQAGEQG